MRMKEKRQPTFTECTAITVEGSLFPFSTRDAFNTLICKVLNDDSIVIKDSRNQEYENDELVDRAMKVLNNPYVRFGFAMMRLSNAVKDFFGL